MNYRKLTVIDSSWGTNMKIITARTTDTLIVVVKSTQKASLIPMKIPDALTTTGLVEKFQSMTGYTHPFTARNFVTNKQIWIKKQSVNSMICNINRMIASYIRMINETCFTMYHHTIINESNARCSPWKPNYKNNLTNTSKPRMNVRIY
jgi:hypothetical protein